MARHVAALVSNIKFQKQTVGAEKSNNTQSKLENLIQIKLGILGNA